jgi:2-keto-3-deoxy-L-rhamnonate aldolase RhmA
MMPKQALEHNNHVVGVLVDLPEGSAVKFVVHRGYDALLCNHVYMRFCQNCPQYRCRKRRI